MADFKKHLTIFLLVLAVSVIGSLATTQAVKAYNSREVLVAYEATWEGVAQFPLGPRVTTQYELRAADGSSMSRTIPADPKWPEGQVAYWIVPEQRYIKADFIAKTQHSRPIFDKELMNLRSSKLAVNGNCRAPGPDYRSVGEQTVLGVKGQKFLLERQVSGTSHKRTVVMAPKLGCLELYSDIYVDGVLKQKRELKTLKVGADVPAVTAPKFAELDYLDFEVKKAEVRHLPTCPMDQLLVRERLEKERLATLGTK